MLVPLLTLLYDMSPLLPLHSSLLLRPLALDDTTVRFALYEVLTVRCPITEWYTV